MAQDREAVVKYGGWLIAVAIAAYWLGTARSKAPSSVPVQSPAAGASMPSLAPAPAPQMVTGGIPTGLSW